MENNPGPKINYQKMCEATVSALPEGKKPRLLFHVCCGPCACYPLLYLAPHFDVVIYYANSNIYPEREYARRLGELKKLLDFYKQDYGYTIELVIPPYDNEAYQKELERFGPIPEGGERCFYCYERRMEEAYGYAEANGFDYFTTVMTVSRQKNSQKLNEIGEALSKRHPGVIYLHSDFKKNDGALKGQALRDQYGLYQQLYCGCLYSYESAKAKFGDAVDHPAPKNKKSKE